MLDEEPRMFFIRFWANDDFLKLATGIAPRCVSAAVPPGRSRHVGDPSSVLPVMKMRAIRLSFWAYLPLVAAIQLRISGSRPKRRRASSDRSTVSGYPTLPPIYMNLPCLECQAKKCLITLPFCRRGAENSIRPSNEHCSLEGSVKVSLPPDQQQQRTGMINDKVVIITAASS
jgi:hypothetical protein